MIKEFIITLTKEDILIDPRLLEEENIDFEGIRNILSDLDFRGEETETILMSVLTINKAHDELTLSAEIVEKPIKAKYVLVRLIEA